MSRSRSKPPGTARLSPGSAGRTGSGSSGGGTGAVVMAVVTLWCAALAAGFGWAAVTAADRLGPARTALFAVLAGLLALGASRTGLELLRRMRHSA